MKCEHSKLSPEYLSCPNCNKWARERIDGLKTSAVTSITIYTYGLVACSKLGDADGNTIISRSFRSALFSNLLLYGLTFVSLSIQIVIPTAIFTTKLIHHGASKMELCPYAESWLTKFISLTLSLFYVIFTINICLSKLRGLLFLKLFVKVPSRHLFFADLGIVSNLTSMGTAAIVQYLLFLRNARDSNGDYITLVLQSLAMQFVLTADQNLMNLALTNWTRSQVMLLSDNIIIDKDDSKGEGDETLLMDDTEWIESKERDTAMLSELTMKKVRFIYIAETYFLSVIAIGGVLWSFTLAYCM